MKNKTMTKTTLILNRKSLIFILTVMLPFTSCKEDEEIAIDLKIDKNTLEIVQGKTAVINIESGMETIRFPCRLKELQRQKS